MIERSIKTKAHITSLMAHQQDNPTILQSYSLAYLVDIKSDIAGFLELDLRGHGSLGATA